MPHRAKLVPSSREQQGHTDAESPGVPDTDTLSLVPADASSRARPSSFIAVVDEADMCSGRQIDKKGPVRGLALLSATLL